MKRSMYKKIVLGVFASALMSVCIYNSQLYAAAERVVYPDFYEYLRLAPTNNQVAIEKGCKDREQENAASTKSPADKASYESTLNKMCGVLKDPVRRASYNEQHASVEAQWGNSNIKQKFLYTTPVANVKNFFAGNAQVKEAVEKQVGIDLSKAPWLGFPLHNYLKVIVDGKEQGDLTRLPKGAHVDVSLDMDKLPVITVQWQNDIGIKRHFPVGTTIGQIKGFFAGDAKVIEAVKSVAATRLLTLSPSYMKVNIGGVEECDDGYALRPEDKNSSVVVWITARDVIKDVCRRFVPGSKK